MASATENFERLNELLQRLVHPTCERILETYLHAHNVTFYRFLETHKHRIMHCYRVRSMCCAFHSNCTYPIMSTLSKTQWNFLYVDEKCNTCTKPGCVCSVATTCKKFRNLNLAVICFLITEFSMLDGLEMEALKRLRTFNEEMIAITTGIVPYAEYQTKWNIVTDSLAVLGVTQAQIERIKKLKVARTPSPPLLDDRTKCRCKGCKMLLMVLIKKKSQCGLHDSFIGQQEFRNPDKRD